MTPTTTTHPREAIDPTGIQPGDVVTILLYSDLWTRTSVVAPDGSFVGCGAVANGRAHITWVRRGGCRP